MKVPFNVAIIGSGPSAFYTAQHLITKIATPTSKYQPHIHFFEKLSTPFGLSRYGVSPDHQDVKKCEEKFTEIIETNQPYVKFYGNAEIGSKIKLQTILDNYHSIVFAYGCNRDNSLNVPGESLPGVLKSKEFVGWYNGLPEHQSLDPPLDKVEDAVIVGNGNVSLDIARVLLAPWDYWSKTDISRVALEKLKKSTIKNVTIVGRRGFLQSAFTNKEFRELFELHQHGVKFEGIEDDSLEGVDIMKSQLNRVDKRKLQILEKFSSKKLSPENPVRTWSLKFLRSPKEIYSNSNNPTILSSSKFTKNNLYQSSPTESPKVQPTEDSEFIKNEILITAIGYKGSPLEGFKEAKIPFDSKRGVIPNVDGQIYNPETNEKISGLYASGWIRKGATGILASTMMDSFTTGELIFRDLVDGKIDVEENKRGLNLTQENDNIVDWKQWEIINGGEIKEGEKNGVCRVKKLDFTPDCI